MRFSGRDGIARAITVTTVGRRVIVVHAFVKKSQTTPKPALDLAERRAKEVQP
jgi:phage-related protein